MQLAGNSDDEYLLLALPVVLKLINVREDVYHDLIVHLVHTNVRNTQL